MFGDPALSSAPGLYLQTVDEVDHVVEAPAGAGSNAASSNRDGQLGLAGGASASDSRDGEDAVPAGYSLSVVA